VGTELLIQSEIDSVINDWFRALSETINTHVSEIPTQHSAKIGNKLFKVTF